VFTAGARYSPGESVPNIDDVAIQRAGNGDERFGHLSFYPTDGTQLTGSPGSKKYTVQAGVAVPYTGSAAFPATSLVIKLRSIAPPRARRSST
jgi:hypothetical protein